ncbi:hypothetical protein F5880DRAFT_1512373, partial [Lentinula raphanica]
MLKPYLQPLLQVSAMKVERDPGNGEKFERQMPYAAEGGGGMLQLVQTFIGFLWSGHWANPTVYHTIVEVGMSSEAQNPESVCLIQDEHEVNGGRRWAWEMGECSSQPRIPMVGSVLQKGITGKHYICIFAIGITSAHKSSPPRQAQKTTGKKAAAQAHSKTPREPHVLKYGLRAAPPKVRNSTDALVLFANLQKFDGGFPSASADQLEAALTLQRSSDREHGQPRGVVKSFIKAGTKLDPDMIQQAYVTLLAWAFMTQRCHKDKVDVMKQKADLWLRKNLSAVMDVDKLERQFLETVHFGEHDSEKEHYVQAVLFGQTLSELVNGTGMPGSAGFRVGCSEDHGWVGWCRVPGRVTISGR